MSIKKTATKKTAAKKPAATTTRRAPAKKAALAPRRRTAPAPVPSPLPEPQPTPVGEQQPPAVEPSPHLSSDAAAHLAGLAQEAAGDGGAVNQGEGGPDAGPTPEQMAADQAQAEAARMGAMMSAHVVVGLGEKVITHYHPYVVVDNEQKQSLAQALADVLAKYAGSGTLPPWVIKYVLPFIEELKLMAKVGVIGYSVYVQVQREKQRLAEEAEKAAQQRRQGQGVDLSTGAPA